MFTIRDTEDERIKLLVPGPDLARSGTSRSATLTVTGTPNPNAGGFAELIRTFTVNVVPGLAVEIRLTRQIQGGQRETWSSDELYLLQQNRTLTVTMAALDQKGREVAVTAVTWSDNGSPRYTITPTADPKVVTLTVDSLSGFIEDQLLVSCDADVAAEVVTLEASRSLKTVESAPTQLAGLYDIEWPA